MTSQPHLPFEVPPALPNSCTQADFARLLMVSEGLVSRWKSDKRLDLDRAGHVRTVPSLLALARSLDQTRGGRRGSATAGMRTMQRIESLIAAHTGSRSNAALEARVAELAAALDAERKRSVTLHRWACSLIESRERQARELRSRVGTQFAHLVAASYTGDEARHLDALWRDVTGECYGEAMAPDDDDEPDEFDLTPNAIEEE